MLDGTRRRCPGPALVATDLDGTIIRSDGTISTRTVKALAAAEKAGATVVLVTGRPPRWIAGIAEQTDHHGIVICSNGAIIYDLPTERILQSTLIPSSLVLTVIERLSTALPDLGFAVENESDVYRSHAYRGGWLPRARPCLADLRPRRADGARRRETARVTS